MATLGEDLKSYKHQNDERRLGFYEGWLKRDSHNIITIYVVTRCEEHSDYPEIAFSSKEKAVEYCKQFEDSEDEYSRNITEIKLEFY